MSLLGHWVDIATEFDLLSRHLDLHHCSDIYQCFIIYLYLKTHPYSNLVMNLAYMNVKDKFGKRFNVRSSGLSFMATSRNNSLIIHQKHWVRELGLLGIWTRIIQVIRSLVRFIPGFSSYSNWRLSSSTISVSPPLSHPRLAPKLLPLLPC